MRPPRCPACVMQRSPPRFCLPCVAWRMGIASPRDSIFALHPIQRMSAETPYVGPVISLLSHRQTKGQHRSSRKVTMVPATKDNVIAVYAATRSNARPCLMGKRRAHFADPPRWLRPIRSIATKQVQPSNHRQKLRMQLTNVGTSVLSAQQKSQDTSRGI